MDPIKGDCKLFNLTKIITLELIYKLFGKFMSLVKSIRQDFNIYRSSGDVYVLRVGNTTGYNMKLGYFVSSAYATIQSYYTSESTYGTLALNPLGGNVGIGTSSPTQLLLIESTGLATLLIKSNTSGSTSSMLTRIILNSNIDYCARGILVWEC